MNIPLVLLPPLAGEGGTLNCAPSAVADAGNGWDGGEKHGLDTLLAFTPTLALPRQGEGVEEGESFPEIT